MRTLYAALAGFLLGVSAFFTFVVPEAAFSSIGVGRAAPFLGLVFPRFYLLTAVATTVLTILGFLLPNGRRVLYIAPLASLVLTLIAWFGLLPVVNRSIGTAAFGTLHGISIGLDLVAMLLWLIAILGVLARKKPAPLPRVR